MSQFDLEEENQFIQRFDTETIRDFDFPKESGDLPMPPQQTETAAHPEPESAAKPSEQADENQGTRPGPIVSESSGPEPGPLPEAPPPQAAEPAIAPVEAPKPEPADTPVVQVLIPLVIVPPQAPPVSPEPALKPESTAATDIHTPQAAEKAPEQKPVQPKKPPEPPAQHTAHFSKPPKRLNPRCIPKYVSQLVKPPVYCPVSAGCDDEKNLYVIDVSEFKQQLLPDCYPETTVWGYGGTVMDETTCEVRYFRNSPGATFEAVRNVPIRVKWVNNLTDPHLLAVDPTLHWANPNGMPMEPPKPWPPFPPGFPEAQSPVPIVTHLHGGEVPSVFDGHPDAWFTHDGITGPAYCTSVYTYPNSQDAATLWYHDHALGITRLNVYAGLAGFYLLRSGKEFAWQREAVLPKGRYEIPLVIQDRSFNTDGSLAFTNTGVNPNIHPYWDPEFFGDTIMVNGKVWPNLNVERRQYRFRLLNGSNARFYNLRMSNGMAFTQIGTDGGFLPEPVTLESLLLAPGERADILVDFSCVAPGTKIIMTNDAGAPYPDGGAPDPRTTGQIMQLTVPEDVPEPVKPGKLPVKLNSIPALQADSPQRILTLYEVPGPNGPLIVLLNGQRWEAPISELPRVGSTEDWVIVNLTMDAHPIHLHLVQFLLLDRQDFKADKYRLKWEMINGRPPLNHPTKVLPVEPYLLGSPIAPDQNETGWKDTVRANPNQVTRFRVRYAPQSVPVRASKPWLNLYPFDPHIGPGYVWHCHILDHEDNEMMRPYRFKQL